MLGKSFCFVAPAQIWEGRIKGTLAHEALFRKFLRDVVIVPLLKKFYLKTRSKYQRSDKRSMLNDEIRDGRESGEAVY